MPKLTVELPDVPDGWLDPPYSALPYAPKGKPPVAVAETRGGILGGWQPQGWNPRNSGLHFLLGPETVADIDFGDGNEAAEVDGLADPISSHKF